MKVKTISDYQRTATFASMEAFGEFWKGNLGRAMNALGVCMDANIQMSRSWVNVPWNVYKALA